MDTIECMRTFLTVAECGSFTKAAEQLSVSTNLVSKNVARLEQKLNVQLLNRTTRRVNLTEVGRSYMNDSRSLLEEFDRVEENAVKAHATPKGHVRVTAPVTFGEQYLAGMTADFLNKWQDISVELLLTDKYMDLIDEGLDLGVRIGHLADSSMIAKKLTDDPMVLCAAPEYLKKRGTPITPEDLKNHDCIIDSNLRSGSQWPFNINGEIKSFQVRGRLQVNSAQAAKNAAISGLGIILAPFHAVRNDIESKRLQPILKGFMQSKLGVYAIYPQNRHLATKVRLFIDFLASNLPVKVKPVS